MKRFNRLIRSVLFLLVLAVAVYLLQGIFGYDSKYVYESRRSFHTEKKDRLDGVYIGGSDAFFFWQPLFGWRDHGIAVMNYCSSSMRAAAVKYFIKEAKKRQPDALFIISLNTFKNYDALNVQTNILHSAVDYMPLSLNVFQLTHELTERSEFTGLDRLEYYLPIIRFHSRWDEMESWSYGAIDVNYRSSLYQSAGFLGKHKDFTDKFKVYSDSEPLSDDMQGIVEDLLDYCDANRLNVLFVKVPQSISKEEQGRLNTLQARIAERGYPCLDLFDRVSELGLDLRGEWCDANHANIHGSLKVSKAIGDYLVEHYAFTDKRDLPEWADWNASDAEYMKIAEQYTLPFERDHAPRVLTDIPTLSRPSVHKQAVTVKWKDSGEADGYVVYRKCESGEDRSWHEAAETDADCREWRDEGLAPKTSYTYTVVPYVTVEGERVYGSFDIDGTSAKTKGET